MELLTTYLPIINIVVLFVLMLASVFTQWGRQRSEVTRETIDLYEKQSDALKDEVLRMREANHQLRNDMTTLSLKIGKLEGILQEKDKKIDDLTSIVQNRNPELEGYIKQSSLALIEIKDFMKKLSQQQAIATV